MSMPSSRLEVATTALSRPRLEVVFDLGALLLADRAVVGPGQQRGAPKVWPLPMMCAGAPPPTCGLGSAGSSMPGPFGVNLVEPGR